ncbi:MAG: OmpW family protein [Acidobacteria bacterium]|nr:OmpW family protein [Acidobacteriota bacterium]
MTKKVIWVVLLALLAGTGAAVAQESANIFRGHVVYVDPTGDENIDIGFDVKLEPDSATGFGISYERRLTEQMGLEFGLFRSEHDVEASAFGDEMTIGDYSFMPFTVALNFHVARTDTLDFYLAPMVAYVMYGDLEANEDFSDDNLKIDDDFGFGAVVGLEVPASGNWAFSAQLKYLKTTASGEDDGDDAEVDINPWILHAGVAYRF